MGIGISDAKGRRLSDGKNRIPLGRAVKGRHNPNQPYIPTSGSAVTRAAETLSYSGAWTADNETRAITDAGTVDTDDWDGIVDATINRADNLAQITSIDVLHNRGAASMKSMSMIFVPEGTDIGVMPAYLQRIIIARLGTEFHAGAWKQIGTRAYDGKFPVYVWTDAEPDELDFLCTLMVAAGFGWEFICGQSGDARDTGEVDAEGNLSTRPLSIVRSQHRLLIGSRMSRCWMRRAM